MTVRYDAAIIGAGADGLAAATMLTRKGLKTIVFERNDRPGALMTTVEFHPGFRASPYVDEIAPIPPNIYWDLDLARRGAVFAPTTRSVAMWPDRQHVLEVSALTSTMTLCDPVSRMRENAIAHAGRYAAPPKGSMFSATSRHRDLPWPGDAWTTRSLQDLLAMIDSDTAAHVAAIALNGRSTDPFVLGSAVHLLAPGAGCSGVVMGGLGRLAQALVSAAEDAGAEIRCGLDTNNLKLDNGRVSSVALVDGSEFEARAIISTLDLKRTFLSLFSWRTLPQQLVARVGAFRMAGATARVLFALNASPAFSQPELLRGHIYIAPNLAGFAAADVAWRAGAIADELPATLRIVSASDPELAPRGSAVLTVTLGAVPFRLFDGAWTREKRDVLRNRALGAAEIAFPGIASAVVAADVITPSDMDESLGATEGDLWGGEIAADQMLGFRPWADPPPPRTPVRGLYLAGPSSPLGPLATCAAGVVAAEAVMADLRTGRDR
jgi:phytoene dehydrogenase-like protein